MAAFPTPWTVTLHARSTGARDSHGNPVETWASPGAGEPVYGWAPPSPDGQPFEPNRTPVVRDLDVYTPATAAKPKDRMTVDGVLYSVVGYPEDFNHGPFGFAPGYRVSLLRIEEAG